MNILETVLQSQGGGAVDKLASQFGLKPEQAQSAVAALLPAVAAGLQRNMATEPGMSSLLNALGQGRHQSYIDDPDTLAQPSTTADGNAILGHLLGSKDVSRTAAARASQQTGIDTGTLKKMLPLVAALAMGGLSKQTKATSDRAQAGAGLASMIGPLLDRDGDGSVANDVAGMLGGLFGRNRR
jgi:hypothetical protein